MLFYKKMNAARLTKADWKKGIPERLFASARRIKTLSLKRYSAKNLKKLHFARHYVTIRIIY